jgi:thiol-disulfide isomerase/thioredoxin
MTGRLAAVLALALITAIIGLAASGDRGPAAGADSTTPPPAVITGSGDAPPTVPPATPAATDIPTLGPAPELTGLDGWLQSNVSSLAELKGKVVLVEFWTFGCINCKHTLPAIREIYADHAGPDFEMVGVHSPEFDYEKDPDAVSRAAAELGVTWPIALDTDRHNFHAWQGGRAYWPRIYILDREGNIRFDHIGEGKYEEMAATVSALLAES